MQSPRDRTVKTPLCIYCMRENSVYGRFVDDGCDEYTAVIEGALDFIQHIQKITSRRETLLRLLEIFESHGTDELDSYVRCCNHEYKRLPVGIQAKLKARVRSMHFVKIHAAHSCPAIRTTREVVKHPRLKCYAV